MKLKPWERKNKNILRWYGTPPYCDVLSIKINNKINFNFEYFFFSKT